MSFVFTIKSNIRIWIQQSIMIELIQFAVNIRVEKKFLVKLKLEKIKQNESQVTYV